MWNESGKPYRWIGTNVDITEVMEERKQHAELHRFFDIGQDLMVILNPEGAIWKSNQSWYHILGYTGEEMASIQFLHLIHPEDMQYSVDSFVNLNNSDKARPFVLRFRHKDETYRWIEWHVQTKDRWQYCTGRDITEKLEKDRKLKANLRIREEHLDLLKLRSASVSDFLNHALNSVIAFTNSQLGYIFLYDEEKKEFNLHSWSETAMEDCRIKVPSRLYHLDKVGLWGEVVRQRKPIIINDYQAPNQMKKGYPKGHVHIKKFISIPVIYDGKIRAVVGAANKSTDYDEDDVLNLTLLMDTVWSNVERIKAEVQVKKSQEELLKFAAQIPGMLYQYEIAPNGKVRVPFTTDAIKDIFGCTPEDVRHDISPVFKVIHPDDVDRMNAAIAESAKNLFPFQFEYRVLHPGQPVHWIMARAMPEKREDGTIIFHGFNADITDRKDIETQLRDREERFRLLFTTSQDAIFITKPDGEILEVNPAAEQLFERSESELKQLGRAGVVDVKDSRLSPALAERRRTGYFKGELNFLHRDGTVFPTELTSATFTDLSGEEETSMFIRDITKRKRAEDLLIKERELFNTTVMSIGEGIVMAKSSGEILLYNTAAERITGYTKEEVLHRNIIDILHLVHIQTGESAYEYIMDMLKIGKQFDGATDFILMAKDGTEKRILISIAPIKGSEGDEDRIIASFRDIGKEYELEKQIQGFLDVNIDMLCVGDLEGNFHKVNKKFERVLGYRTEDIVGENFMSFIHPDDVQKTLDALTVLDNKDNLSGFTNRYRCKDGSYKYIEWNSMPGIGRYIYCSARDVTPQRQLEEQLRQSAIKDELTGLFNRHYFESIIYEQMQIADRYEEPLSMVLLDLDHFKQVNDTWGHPVGDELLKLTAVNIDKAIRESDILVRFGGEEFIVLMPRTSIDGALHAAEKIRAAVENNPLAVVGTQTASLGVAERMKVESFRHWYRRLDKALYQAKQTGRNRVVVSDGSEKMPIRAFDLEWRLDLQSGNNEIDKQHQELFKIGNRLINLSLEGANQEQIMKQLELLLDHTLSHFAFEEKILEQAGYPDLRHHEEIHDELASKALRLRESFINGDIKAPAFFSFT